MTNLNLWNFFEKKNKYILIVKSMDVHKVDGSVINLNDAETWRP